MNLLFSWLTGLIFGLGLLVAGMANPGKVLGFLDIAGVWDPSLAFVMLGGIAGASVGFFFAGKRTRTFLDLPLQMPTARHIDRRLIVGSLLFGIGWGVAGICPGPALVLVGAGLFKGAVFVAAMLVGMGLFEILERGVKRRK
jgi:uncharacterized membrane protein YedE/YeeE